MRQAARVRSGARPSRCLDSTGTAPPECPVVARIVIERLEFQGHCGVTAEERALPQPLGIDLELEYVTPGFDRAAGSDDIGHAIDYAAVTRRVIDTAHARSDALLESLADRISTALLTEFPVTRLRLWLRKLSPPVKEVQGSVGVRLERTRPPSRGCPEPEPSPFLCEHATRLPLHGTALDVAAGHGRNALFLARHGLTVEAIDRDAQALADLEAAAKQLGGARLTTRRVDLEDPARPPTIAVQAYDVIVVFFYLHRPLIPRLLAALKPGGLLIYETFLIDNHVHHQHPRRREFCLEHNELLRLTQGLRVLHYGEGEFTGSDGRAPAFTARLLAVKET